MPKIFQRAEIEGAVAPLAAIRAIEDGFVAYSKKLVDVPPVGCLLFQEPPGDMHIKYGYRRGADTFVIKIASTFYDNPKLNLDSTTGLMLVFSAHTGVLEAILLDGGYLTNLRTAAAGAVVAKYLAPKTVKAIGIFGAGAQAQFQLDMLRHVTDCRRAFVWNRNVDRARALQVPGFQIEVARTPQELLENCNLVVTTTAATSPLFHAADVQPGTHITALGTDASGKQENDPAIIVRADVRVVDSRSQCFEHGDSSHAVKAHLIAENQFIELGELIADPRLGRTSDSQITFADLTGVAIQDIQIAEAVYAQLSRGK